MDPFRENRCPTAKNNRRTEISSDVLEYDLPLGDLSDEKISLSLDVLFI